MVEAALHLAPWTRLGGGVGYAFDPVCGMQVRMADAPAQARQAGEEFWFCSDRCRERFAKGETRDLESREAAAFINDS